MSGKLIESRQSFSESRLALVREKISDIGQLSGRAGLSIYVTGSYGRLEAHAGSDLDLFFVISGDRQIGRTAKTLIDADLIRLSAELGFPPFSQDGKYLEIHSLKEMLDKLGGAEDDYENLFTARMLLLLESRPVFGEDAYQDILRQIIDAYFRDFHDHTGDFRPLFLVNDILRFWKTLCLNYENKRNRAEDRERKNKHHVKNLKLKFSRLSICFSTVIPLLSSRANSPDEILALSELPPLKRLERVAQTTEQKKLYRQLIDLYEYFLDVSSKPDVLDWIGVRENRRIAFPKADEFGATMFSLLTTTLKSSDDMRFLVI